MNRRARGTPIPTVRWEPIMGILVALLVVWAVLVVLGIVVKGLFWLIIVGAVLFVATGVIGFVKREALGRRH